MTEYAEMLRHLSLLARGKHDDVSIAADAAGAITALLAERDALAQDAARWLYVRRYMKLDDIGDEAFCLGLVIDSDALEHAVSDEASRLHEERRAAEWEGVQGPNNGPKDLPPVT